MADDVDSPRLVRRRSGGWLALSQDDQPLKIGIAAETEEAARAEFATSLDAWKKNLASGPSRRD